MSMSSDLGAESKADGVWREREEEARNARLGRAW